jgi:peroxiredoxin Q/BCP
MLAGMLSLHRGGPAALALAGISCAAFAPHQPAAAPAPPPPPVVQEGTAAPDVAAIGPNEKAVRLSDYRGKPLVLFFYPVDFGASATAEAEEFKSDLASYRKLGVTVVGVSTDHVASHKDFTARFKLPFPLLSDPDGAMAHAFGVPLEAGTTRHYTFFIDRQGVIRKSWKNVRAWGHSADVLGYVKSAKLTHPR